ncbi:MAG: deoxyguanosinetriphosphate triphosphohydrolase [Desulfobacterota bacterium]|jgi:dGTPase|nr:deoxyguanosinetriphosphate triphosphohydrolase [Thermodesulfobacteriota bacterium]
MPIREAIEERERSFLAPWAARSAASQGRARAEAECDLRTAFQRDRDRILHSKAFRRLKHKTQVFLSPSGDHYRTRLTHTLEVSQIARTVARCLQLNEDLSEAIALGHDLGHTPFGHAGEEVLHEIVPGGFYHNLQSLRVVDYLEKGGAGLNLTGEVRDGILKHSKGKGEILPGNSAEMAATLEGRVVRLSDIIAYISHDLDDALRGGIIRQGEIPDYCARILGDRSSQRIHTMVASLVSHSRESLPAGLTIGAEVLEAMERLRHFLYERVYEAGRVHHDFTKARKVIRELYEVLLAAPEEIRRESGSEIAEGNLDPQRASDFIAGMTDRYALRLYEKIFLPKPWAVL